MKVKVYLGVMHGTENYAEPCVLVLDHRPTDLTNYTWYVTEAELPVPDPLLQVESSEVEELIDESS